MEKVNPFNDYNRQHAAFMQNQWMQTFIKSKCFTLSCIILAKLQFWKKWWILPSDNIQHKYLIMYNHKYLKYKYHYKSSSITSKTIW